LSSEAEYGGPRLIAAVSDLFAATPPTSVAITGHSLGAALATLTAVDFAVNKIASALQVYTFASPNVGDAYFVQTFNKNIPDAWRFTNFVDVVTHVPPSFLGFSAVDSQYHMNFFDKVQNNLSCFHSLDSYLHFISLESTVRQIPLEDECERP
jgi:predicted lipase